MSDLISREAAINAICEHGTDLERRGITVLAVANHKQVTVDLLEKIPSAERTGRWTHVYDENEKLFFRNKWVCSACGKSNTYGRSDFCPWCGSMMENSTRRMKEAEVGE